MAAVKRKKQTPKKGSKQHEKSLDVSRRDEVFSRHISYWLERSCA